MRAPDNCLDIAVYETEHAQGTVEAYANSVDVLADSVILDAGDGSVEMQCQSCPLMCTFTQVGGTAIALVHNRAACLIEDSTD